MNISGSKRNKKFTTVNFFSVFLAFWSFVLLFFHFDYFS